MAGSKTPLRWIILSVSLSLLVFAEFSIFTQSEGHHETFNDTLSSDWELSDAYVQDGVLHILKSGYAHLDGEWSDFALSIRFQQENFDSFYIEYQVSDRGSYRLFIQSRTSLYRLEDGARQLMGGDYIDFPRINWQQVDIRVVDNIHEVLIDGELVLVTADPAPLPPGGIMLMRGPNWPGQFDDLLISVGDDIPPLGEQAEEFAPLTEIIADPNPAIDEIVMDETAAALPPEIVVGDLHIDSTQQHFIHYEYTLASMAGAHSFMDIEYYPTAESAEEELLSRKSSETECDYFHGFVACWGRQTWVDYGNHHRDRRWISWQHQNRIFMVNTEYASLYAGYATDPAPIAESLLEKAIEHDLMTDLDEEEQEE